MKSKIAVILILSLLLIVKYTVAATQIDVYTMQLKRVAQAIKNLKDAYTFNEEFATLNDMIVAITNAAPEDLPAGFTKSDYGQMLLLRGELRVIMLKYILTIDKFEQFNKDGIVDPLDFLGKRFYIMGDPQR